MPSDSARGLASDWGLPRERTISWYVPIATAERGAQLAGIDYLNAMVADEVPRPPITATLGNVSLLRPIRFDSGTLTATGIARKPGSRVSFGQAASTLLIFPLPTGA